MRQTVASARRAARREGVGVHDTVQVHHRALGEVAEDARIEGADAGVLVTEWNAYRGLDIDEMRRRMRGDTFVDLRNVYEPEEMRRAGLDYHCVGR